MGGAVTAGLVVGTGAGVRADVYADVYKALPLAAYGGLEEEAGALLSEFPTNAGSPLLGTVQASRPSREGPIIAMRTQLSQATQRRKR